MSDTLLFPAARIFHTGRFADGMKNGFESEETAEIEPTDGKLILQRRNILEAYEYKHPVPTEQK